MRPTLVTCAVILLTTGAVLLRRIVDNTLQLSPEFLGMLFVVYALWVVLAFDLILRWRQSRRQRQRERQLKIRLQQLGESMDRSARQRRVIFKNQGKIETMAVYSE